VFASGDAGTGTAEAISDWSTSDKIDIAGGALAGSAYAEILSAASYATALTAANAAFSVAVSVVSVQVGADVYVFIDSTADQTADDAIKLTGVTLDAITNTNFI
jgi:hypothetical protein